MAAYSCLKQATMASLLMTSSMISTSRALQARVAASPSQSFQLNLRYGPEPVLLPIDVSR